MVSNYSPKTNSQKWFEKDMSDAILAIENKEMGWLKSSKQFNVPQATLRRHCQNKNKVAKGGVKKPGRGSILTTVGEKKLVDHILNLESKFFGLTIHDVQKLAFEFAEEAKLSHIFNKEKK